MRSIVPALCVLICVAMSARADEAATGEDPVTALVVTAPVEEQDLQAVIIGFGRVESDPNSVLAIICAIAVSSAGFTCMPESRCSGACRSST